MVNINDIFELFQEDVLGIATEAEDITDDITSQSKSIAESSGVDKSDGTNNGEISTDVDDLFGTKNSKNDHTDDTANNDSSDENPDDNDDNAEGSETPPDLPEESEPSNIPMDNNTDENSDFENSRKIKVWKSLKAYYNTISDSVDLISKFVPDLSDQITIKAIGNVKENLLEAKRLTYNTLVEDYKTMDYKSLEKRYVGLQYIFDLCTEELEMYFDKYYKE